MSPGKLCPLVLRMVPLVALAGCAAQKAVTVAPPAALPRILYVGSSTIANFLREAEPVYGKARFVLDTVPESLGGERAMQEGYADLAGTAREPEQEVLDYGVEKRHLGTDSIAVIVNAENPTGGLTVESLRGIFTGKIRSWRDVGGPDLPVVPFIVGEESATHSVFQSIVLGGAAYEGCRVVRPDPSIPLEVEAEPGAVGAISHSFLCSGGPVRVLRVGGEAPFTDNPRYPIRRPLYLLWRPGKPEVEAFVRWTETPEAQEVLRKCFGPAAGEP